MRNKLIKFSPIALASLIALLGVSLVVHEHRIPEHRKYEPKYLYPELPPLEYPITRTTHDEVKNASPKVLAVTAVDDMPNPVAVGFKRQWIEWTDYGYDSTYCYKPAHDPRVCVNLLLREPDTGVRVIDVPDKVNSMILICATTASSRNREYEIWSIYSPGTPMKYEYSEIRSVGAACVVPIFNVPYQTIELQRTHPYKPPYKEWK